MKIKSLLLGSAAALVAVSGARAADAVVIPEPELVEYVRVCDTYGTGFFYIPGTETCLKFSGFVRYEMNFTNSGSNAEGVNEGPGAPAEIDGRGDWGKRSEIQLNIDARNETALGTLGSHVTLAYQNNPRAIDGSNTSTDILNGQASDFIQTNGRALGVKEAYITLAGLTIGKKTTWWDWGFGGGADAIVNFGPNQVGMVAYTANVGGFGFTVAAEEDESGNYMPDIVVDLNGNVGSFGVRAGLAYNESAEAVSGKIAASYDFGPAALGLGYQYSQKKALGQEYMAKFEHVFGGDISADLTDKLTAGVGFNYGLDNATGQDGYVIGVTANYAVVDGFAVNARVRYSDGDALDLANGDGVVSTRIRLTRSF